VEQSALGKVLEKRAVPGELYKKLPGGKVHCYACGHNCIINREKDGICRVRVNRGGTLYVPTGYVGGIQLDPIEKKPFFHALPGAQALSFGMLGCDYRCSYCQNWLTSQALRDPKAVVQPLDISADDLVTRAQDHGARVITSTYNEPLITSEWAVAVFKKARAKGLVTSYVSNGNGTKEVLTYLRPYVDLYKVDLKGFDPGRYRRLGGELKNVLRTIEDLKDMGFWLEVVTLVVPGFNDSKEELRSIVRFLAGVSKDIPWHVTAFHPDYRMTDRNRTTAPSVIKAATLGKEAGLRYVYAGNIPGDVGDLESTYCPSCNKRLIARVGFRVLEDLVTATGGNCPDCGNLIPGFWTVPERNYSNFKTPEKPNAKTQRKPKQN